MKQFFLSTVAFLSLFICVCTKLNANFEEFMWEEVKFIPEQFKNEYWLEFHFLEDNPKYGFACGGDHDSPNGVFAKTSDSGKTWYASKIAENFHAESIHFADTNIGYVSGTGAIYKTINGGISWKRLTVNYGDNINNDIYGCWGNYITDANNIWLAQGNCGLQGEQVIYKSTNGGNNWTYFAQKEDNTHLTDLIIYDKNGLGYAISSGNLWQTNNGGNNWFIVNETPVIIWNNNFFTRHNWHEDLAIYSNSNNSNDKSVLIPMSPACDGNGIRLDEKGALAFSRNLGENWNILLTNGQMFGTFLLNDSTGWGCGYNQEIYYTTNSGLNWHLLNCGIPPETNLDDLWFINDTVGFVSGTNGIWRLVRRNTDIAILGDSVKCEDDFTELTANKDFHFYEWYEITNSGDTVFVSEEKTLFAEKNGTYILRGGYKNCDFVESKPFTVTISGKNKPILVADGELSFCKNFKRTIKLTNAELFTVNTWYCGSYDSNENYEIKEIAKNVSEYEVTVSGKYYVIVSINNACVDTSDVLEATIRDEVNVLDFSANEIPFFIDSVNFGKQSSKYFKITNKGDKEFVLTHIYFSQKFAFTAPQSQFPIIIQPKETKEILIYYSPTNINFQADTMFLQDNCSTHLIALSGFGKKNFDSAVSLCDVDINVATNSVIQKKIFTVGSVVPNPASSKAKISYTVTTDLLAEDFGLPLDIRVMILDVLGNEISTNFIKETATVERNEHFETEIGDLLIDVNDLHSGFYFLHINLGETNYLQPLIK